MKKMKMLFGVAIVLLATAGAVAANLNTKYTVYYQPNTTDGKCTITTPDISPACQIGDVGCLYQGVQIYASRDANNNCQEPLKNN